MKGQYAGFYALAVMVGLLLYFGVRLSESGGLPAASSARVSAASPEVVRTATGAQDLLIPASRGGAYMTEVYVNGSPVVMLVDTGASYVTLRDRDALSAGINPNPGDYRYRFSTANGQVEAARAELDRFELGPVMLENVTAFIIPDDKLEVSLLGMNALQEFGRVEMSAEGLRLSFEDR